MNIQFESQGVNFHVTDNSLVIQNEFNKQSQKQLEKFDDNEKTGELKVKRKYDYILCENGLENVLVYDVKHMCFCDDINTHVWQRDRMTEHIRFGCKPVGGKCLIINQRFFISLFKAYCKEINSNFMEEEIKYFSYDYIPIFKKKDGIYSLTKKLFSCFRIFKGKNLSLFDGIQDMINNPGDYRCKRNTEESKSPLVIKIDTPKFEKEIGAKGGKFFDFIRIRVVVPSKMTIPSNKTIKEMYIRDKNIILNEVIQKIENGKRFQSYGIPVNFLKISRITLLESREIEYLFELKDGIREIMDSGCM